MADSGGEPTDGPKARGAERQHRVTRMTKHRPMERALLPTTLADECTFHLSHNGASDSIRRGRRPAWWG